MAKRPPAKAVHLIETRGYFTPIAGRQNEFTSGYWAIPLHVAQTLHGAMAFFHERQTSPAFRGGRIIDSRAATLDEYPKPGRVVFRIQEESECVGVTTDSAGWAQEKKYVR